MSDDDDFDKMMKELDAGAPAAPAPAPAAPARRGKKPTTVVEEAPPPAPPEAPAEPALVKIAGIVPDDPEPKSVTVTVVEDVPPAKTYLSPQTLAEMEAGRLHLQRFK